MSRRRRQPSPTSSVVDEVHELRAQFGQLEERTTSIAAGQIRIAEKIDRLEAAIATAGRTDMRLLVSAGSLVVALVGGLVALASWGPLDTLAQHEREFEQGRIAAVQAAEERGRARALAEQLARQVEQLDTSLQREMRDLDGVTEARLEALDRRVQQEMRLLDDPIMARLQKVESDLGSRKGARWNRPEQNEYAARVAADIQDLREQVRALGAAIAELRVAAAAARWSP